MTQYFQSKIFSNISISIYPAEPNCEVEICIDLLDGVVHRVFVCKLRGQFSSSGMWNNSVVLIRLLARDSE